MCFRCKTSAGRAYLQIVESRRGNQVRQQVITTSGVCGAFDRGLPLGEPP
jgi:hypothetical protein